MLLTAAVMVENYNKTPFAPFCFLPRNYVIMVTMFFTVSVINNYALNFNIAMPLHMIFRSVRTNRCRFSTLNVLLDLTTSIHHPPIFGLLSLQGSLIANMILGIIILKKRYPCLLGCFISDLIYLASWVWLQLFASHRLSAGIQPVNICL